MVVSHFEEAGALKHQELGVQIDSLVKGVVELAALRRLHGSGEWRGRV
jgi:hypothetical protein